VVAHLYRTTVNFLLNLFFLLYCKYNVMKTLLRDTFLRILQLYFVTHFDVSVFERNWLLYINSDLYLSVV